MSALDLKKIVFALALLLGLAQGIASAGEGFKPLFDGKTLTGWNGDPRLWKVEDGMIVGSTHGVTLKANSFLSYERPFSDFELHFKVKLENHNSGMQFRSEQLPNYAVAGYQADVAEATYFGASGCFGLRRHLPRPGQCLHQCFCRCACRHFYHPAARGFVPWHKNHRLQWFAHRRFANCSRQGAGG